MDYLGLWPVRVALGFIAKFVNIDSFICDPARFSGLLLKGTISSGFLLIFWTKEATRLR